MRTPKYNSPSAINTINRCRRKYYYKYKLGIPEKTSIEALLGNIIHKAIEKKIASPKKSIEDIFNLEWQKNVGELQKIKAKDADLKKLHDEYKDMAVNWEKDYDAEAKMQAEVSLKSDKYQVTGIIDEISEKNKKVRILDNKSSKYEAMTKYYEAQLAIYALLYLENFGKLPDHLGVRFLRSGKKQYIPVNDKLLSKAVYECKMMRVKNHSPNVIEYPRNQSILCNWGRGKCSYIERCFP